jgi:hypothetical protein
MDKATAAVQRALTTYPGSLRTLATEAGVTHTLLVYIRQGKRTATPDVALRVADALERIARVLDQDAKDHRSAARSIRKATTPRR